MSKTEIAKGFKKLTAGPLDDWYGPYDTLAAACQTIPNVQDPVSGINMRESKVIGIKTVDGILDYHWPKNYTDADLKLKTDLSPYVQKINNPMGYYGPYESISSAINAVPNIIINGISLRRGKIVGINTPQGLTDYCWRNGVLDDNLVPYIKISLGPFENKGSYNAEINEPPTSDTAGKNGWTLTVTTAGTHNFGSGNISLAIGDRLVHNGSIWQRIPPEDSTTSSSDETFIII